jgi:hypothetical protein
MSRRGSTAAVALALAFGPACALASGAGHGRTHRLVQHIRGTQVAASSSIFSGRAVLTYAVAVTGTDGRGHGRFVNTELGLADGSTRGTIHYAAGSVSVAGTYRVVKIAFSGPVQIAAAGHFTGGSGRYRGIGGHFTGSGTLNLTTKVLTLTIRGKSTY